MNRLSLNPSFGCGNGGQKQNRELSFSPLSPQELCRLPQELSVRGKNERLMHTQTTTLGQGGIRGNMGMREKVNYKVFYLKKSQNFLGILHLKNQLRDWSKTKAFFRRVLQLQITSNLTKIRAEIFHESQYRCLALISCLVSIVINMGGVFGDKYMAFMLYSRI